MSIKYYTDKMNEAKEEDGEESNLYSYYKVMLEIAQQEDEDNRVIEHFTGKTKKAIKLMKEINDLDCNADDDHPINQDDVDKLVKKVKHNLESQELNLELKIRELTKLKDNIELVKMYTINDYRDPTMWFYKIKDFVKDIWKREND